MVIQQLIDTLQAVRPAVYEQGTWPQGKPYPERFFTFWNADSADQNHYDNAATGCVWTVEVNYYGTDPLDVYSTLEAARVALLAAGWTISGKGRAVASDNPTHTGRGFTAYYLETTN